MPINMFDDIPTYNEEPDDWRQTFQGIPPEPRGRQTIRYGATINVPDYPDLEQALQAVRPAQPRLGGQYIVPDIFQYGVTKQRTLNLDTRLYDEMDIDESIHDWYNVMLFEGNGKIGNLYVHAITADTHGIAFYSQVTNIKSTKPSYTMMDLLPHLLEKYMEYPHVEHIIAEVYEPDTTEFRTQARYEELGFQVMFKDDIKIWMILNLL